MPALVEARRGPRERERDEEPEQRKDRPFRCADALPSSLRILPHPTDADPSADLQKHHHPDEEPERNEENEKGEDHGRPGLLLPSSGARSVRERTLRSLAAGWP